jgi:hypothetical protein
MRTRRILVVAVCVVATGLFSAGPASAGGWEETLLDPPPTRVSPGVTYTFGYWILQHGSYPFDGDLGATGLRATSGDGTIVDFPGTESHTDGHYSAEVVFPEAGVWTISSRHDMLMPDENVAVVEVPGSVRITPSDVADRADHEWGAVRPSFPPTAPDAELGAPPATGSPEVAPRAARTTDEPGHDLPVWLVVAGGVATVAFAVLLARRGRRSQRG